MTIRELMDRRKRRFSVAALSCVGCFEIGVFLAAPLGGVALLLAVAGFVVYLGCIIYAQHVGFLCPRCRGPWLLMVMQAGYSPFWIDPRLRYCPYCGADIDAKDGVPRKPGASNSLD